LFQVDVKPINSQKPYFRTFCTWEMLFARFRYGY